MKIQDMSVVHLQYTLEVEGKIVEDEQVEYLHGADNIVPGLEKALEGKHVGDKIAIELKPEEAYGEYDEDDTETFLKKDLPGSEMLEEGMEIVLEDEDGYEFEAFVKAVTENEVTLDFNPEYAGKTCLYKVEILGIRESSEEEQEAGFPKKEEVVFEDDQQNEDLF